MSWKLLAFTLLLTSLPLLAQTTEEPEPEEMKPTVEALRERVSMALGHQAGMRAKLKRIEKSDVTSSQFTKGFELALKGEPLPFSPEEIREAFSILQKEITKREIALAEANKAAQELFLTENGTKEEITTLESGLQYRVLEPGKDVAEGDQAEVHYVGTLLNGEEFEASQGDKPTILALDEVIAGFREAVTMMPVGARWKIFVPSDLAYGEVRRSDLIGPNQLLIFEIELVAMKSSKPSEPE